MFYSTMANVSDNIEKLGKPIWERLYMVGVRLKDTYSDDEIRNFGLPSVGDPIIDQSVQNDFIDRYVTIDFMVELFKKNLPFIVRNPRETKEIYEVISAYLNCWKVYLDNGINIGNAPIEDLIELDRLASKVYDHAIEHFTTDYISKTLSQFIGEQKLGRLSFARKEAPLPSETLEVKKHTSLSKLFSETIYRGR